MSSLKKPVPVPRRTRKIGLRSLMALIVFLAPLVGLLHFLDAFGILGWREKPTSAATTNGTGTPTTTVPAVATAIPLAPGMPTLSEFEPLRRKIDSAPASADASLDDLAAFLATLTTTDRERAYALFYWLATHIRYDIDGYRRKDYGDLSAESVLRRREAVCAGYSQLFQALAQRLGLTSVEIAGLSKGYGFAALGQLGEHAWNAVQIDGAWQLIDSTWGAGYIDTQDKFVRTLNHFYFLAPPWQFIYSHFPQEKRWQLLPKPLSRAEFDRLPDLKPIFFALGLEWSSPVAARISAKGGLKLRLKSSRDVAISVNLERAGRVLPDRFALIERDGKQWQIRILFPEPGRYETTLFAKPAGQEGPLPQAARLSIDVAGGQGWKAGFPETLAAFTRAGATLMKPLAYYLKAGRSTRFDVRIPEAAEVAIKDATGQWHALDRTDHRFTADIKLPPGPVQLLANFLPGDRTYEVLASYVSE